MKITRILTAGALLASASLVGCTPSQTANIDKIVADVQKATTTACAVEPTAASVAAIIATLNPAATAGVAIASQIAASICKAVTASSATPAKVGGSLVPAPVTVDGVTVQFELVK